ncbi:MAG: RNA polymerase sigma factor [Pseudonocardia sp.]
MTTAPASDRPRDVRRAVDAVWRIESARLVAGLARYAGDLGLAEELAQDALVAALEQWPRSGIPDNPGAWLTAVAKRRAVDGFRRNDVQRRKYAELGRAQAAEAGMGTGPAGAGADGAGGPAVPGPEDGPAPDEIADDLLRLVFTACHPVLPAESRVALTLRVLGGLSTREIARAFLVPEPTVAQRIVRAKKTLAKAGVAFEVPVGPELAPRLASVLEVVYLVFNEGYSATAGEDWMRPALCEDAMRLGRMIAELAPAEPEVHGLVALMEIQASRTRARTGSNGVPILLLDQDRGRWDQLLIRRGLAALERGSRLGGPPGPYLLQAAIAACHARARVPGDTDWSAIAALYDRLERVTGSPVVRLNRAVALSMSSGPGAGPVAGLALVDELLDEPALRSYHLLPSVRGDLLMKLGRRAEARAEFERAAELTGNQRERTLLRERAAAC